MVWRQPYSQARILLLDSPSGCLATPLELQLRPLSSSSKFGALRFLATLTLAKAATRLQSRINNLPSHQTPTLVIVNCKNTMRNAIKEALSRGTKSMASTPSHPHQMEASQASSFHFRVRVKTQPTTKHHCIGLPIPATAVQSPGRSSLV